MTMSLWSLTLPLFAVGLAASLEFVTLTPPGSPVVRQFLVHRGGSCTIGQPCAAVMLLHGLGETPYAIANYTGLVPQLVSRGWVGALPFGLSVNNRTGPGACCDPGCDAACCAGGVYPTHNVTSQCGWNTDHATTGPWPAPVNDVVFLRAVAEWLQANASVDPAKVMVTGMSAGAMMANRMGCDAAETFAAVAAVEGNLMDNSKCEPRPAKQLPWLGFCGSLDFVCRVMGTTFKKTTLDWASRNGCTLGADPKSVKVSNTTTCDSYVGCARPTEACSIAGMGHKWPGIPGERKGNVNATDFIFHFFDKVAAATSGNHV